MKRFALIPESRSSSAVADDDMTRHARVTSTKLFLSARSFHSFSFFRKSLKERPPPLPAEDKIRRRSIDSADAWRSSAKNDCARRFAVALILNDVVKGIDERGDLKSVYSPCERIA